MDAEIKQQFDEMGVEPTEPVMDKCIELALSYNIDDATEFVEQWMAFSLSHLNGDDPTTENLGEFERKVLQLKREKGSKQATHITKRAPVADTLGDDDAAMMDDYVNESTKVESTLPHTPKAKINQPRTSALKGGILFSPASYSPQSVKRTPTVAAATPGRSGDIVDTFGHRKLLTSATWKTQMEQQPPLNITQKLLHKDAPLGANNFGYMNDVLNDKCEVLHDRLLDIGQALVHKRLGDEGATECSWYPQDKHTLQALHLLHAVGMVHSDDDGPLDAHSVLLTVPEDHSILTLNLQRIKSTSIFPGQVILATGFISKGNTFVVEEIHTERKLLPPLPLKLDRELLFVVAAGPYTHSSDLFYDPLHELVSYLKEHRPDVLVLTGPFIDAEHKAVGDLAETFDSFFEKMIAGIMEVVGSHATVLLISCQKDAVAHAVYPTPPVTLRKLYPNLHLLPDPTLIDLDGITLGVTSTDVVDHLLSQELAINAGDKMHRVINHLFNQGSFYPIYPPADETMCYDSLLAENYAQINQLPNILILPSDQRYFVRLVNDCLVINPGRLSNKQAAGTFARFLVTPTAPESKINMFNSVACQIRRI